MPKEAKFLSGGEWRRSADKFEVKNPYNGEVVVLVHRAAEKDAEFALSMAEKAFEETRRLPDYKKYRILSTVAQKITELKEEFVKIIVLEAGKPIRDARVEVDRAITTFTASAEESKRLYGEYIPLEWNEGSERRAGIIRRFPLGIILAITPFNFPLNLVCHKVGPALASGNAIIVRPASQTPSAALLLGKIIDEAGWPKGGISIMPSSTQLAGKILADQRIKKLSFTGSDGVGWALKQKAWDKKVTLELGGNAGVIIHEDADLDYAVQRCVSGGFAYAGQSCISVQRIFVHEKKHDEFAKSFIERVKKLVLGNPMDEKTDIGPMIDLPAAERTDEWIREAVNDGAKILSGGGRTDSILEPTVLTNVKSGMKVCTQEVFAPVVTLTKYTDFDAVLKEINTSRYGLQTGVFTKDIGRIFKAFEELEVGGVIINDVPTWRSDPMPYGGVKNSGMGREGIRFAIEEMTDMRIMVLNLRNS